MSSGRRAFKVLDDFIAFACFVCCPWMRSELHRQSFWRCEGFPDKVDLIISDYWTLLEWSIRFLVGAIVNNDVKGIFASLVHNGRGTVPPTNYYDKL